MQIISKYGNKSKASRVSGCVRNRALCEADKKNDSFFPDEVNVDFLGGVTFYQVIRWKEKSIKEGRYGMLYGIKGKKSENKYLASQAYRSKLVREFWRTKCNVYIESQKK